MQTHFAQKIKKEVRNKKTRFRTPRKAAEHSRPPDSRNMTSELGSLFIKKNEPMAWFIKIQFYSIPCKVSRRRSGKPWRSRQARCIPCGAGPDFFMRNSIVPTWNQYSFLRKTEYRTTPAARKGTGIRSILPVRSAYRMPSCISSNIYFTQTCPNN